MALRKTGRLWFVALFVLSFGVGYAQRASAWWPGGEEEQCVDEWGNRSSDTEGCDSSTGHYGVGAGGSRATCSCPPHDEATIFEMVGASTTLQGAIRDCEARVNDQCKIATQDCRPARLCCDVLPLTASDASDGTAVYVTCSAYAERMDAR